MSAPITDASIVDRYLELGLRMGRHIDGFVDAYYGPEMISDRVAAEPVQTPDFLVASAGQLVVDLDAGVDDEVLDASRRRWLRAQATGMHTSARKMAGEDIAYVDEVEWCYGVRPTFREEDQFAAAHARLDAVLPGSGSIRDRIIEWREAQAIPVERLDNSVCRKANTLLGNSRRISRGRASITTKATYKVALRSTRTCRYLPQALDISSRTRPIPVITPSIREKKLVLFALVDGRRNHSSASARLNV